MYKYFSDSKSTNVLYIYYCEHGVGKFSFNFFHVQYLRKSYIWVLRNLSITGQSTKLVLQFVKSSFYLLISPLPTYSIDWFEFKLQIKVKLKF